MSGMAREIDGEHGSLPRRAGNAQAQALAAFGNRLARNVRHWGRWAKRQGYGAYRVYDRDQPEFPLAIDCYEAEDPVLGRRVHLQEIETGWIQTEAEHAEWVGSVQAVVHAVLGVADDAVAFKTRRKRRGLEQHAKTGCRGTEFVVREAGLRFVVNLEAYLDTGLFLDHRKLRAIVRSQAAGRRVLNLFAYTGSFTVYAAAGGAVASDTVDLSNTYLEWAARNFAANDLDRTCHRLTRADARLWLAEARATGRRYDLVVLDPPSFSNSKAMADDFDIQRDHVTLIAAARALLAPGGLLFFSTNLRSFCLDAGLASDPACSDISAQTLPEDFRDRRVHQAFRFGSDRR